MTERADVVILAAIGEEYEAVLAVEEGAAPSSRWELETFYGLPIAKRVFEGRAKQPLTVVVGRAADMGRGAAVAVLRPLVDGLTPSCIAMCGVCGAHPDKTSLGDVVAGERIYDYDVGKRTPRGLQADRRTYSVPATWKVALESFKANARFGGKEWFEARPVPYEWQERWALWQFLHGVADPRKLPDATRLCREWTTVIKRLWEAGDVELGTMTLTEKGRARATAVAVEHTDFPDLTPAGNKSVLPFRFHAAVIGTGAAIVEDPEAWKEIRSHMRTTTAVEMECSALAEVVRAREDLNLRALAMKGVMDLTTDGRDDQFKPFAARASAECLLAFLRDLLPGDVRSAADAREASDAGGRRPTKPARYHAPSSADAARLLDRWIERGKTLHSQIPVITLRLGDRRPAMRRRPIEQVFVPLEMRLNDHEKHRIGAERVTLERALELARRTEEHGDRAPVRMVLIGEPGAGKTTILRHLFGRVVAREGGEALSGFHPVWVNLKTIERTDTDADDLSGVVLRAATRHGHGPAAAALFDGGAPRALLLLDGLDEVRDPELRRETLALVDRSVERWPASAFVLTSRRTQWEELERTSELGAVTSHFELVSVKPLDETGLRAYVTAWCGAMGRGQEATTLIAEFEAAQRSRERLRLVMSNPLMLSAVCALRACGEALPRGPAEVYDVVLRLLIEGWHRDDVGLLPLDEVRTVLEPLAYRQQDHGGPLDLADARQVVDAPLRETKHLRTEVATADAFIDVMRERCGILAGDEIWNVEFLHLQFREYLAACHVSRWSLGTKLASKLGGADEADWAETMRLAMLLPGVSGPFLGGALAGRRVLSSREVLRQCVLEAGPACDATAILSEIDAHLERLRGGTPERQAAIDDAEALLFLVEGVDIDGVAKRREALDRATGAAVAGRSWQPGTRAALDVAGATEPPLEMTFEWVEPGSFRMGPLPSDRESVAWGWPAHRVHITRGFWLATYPVTNQQYGAFIAAYPGARPPSFWNDRGFSDPRQPVVGVSWEEARRFCNWVNERVPPAAGYCFRLPTEAEWEYAARGTESSQYPWGFEPPDATRAEFGHANRAPSLIDAHPHGKSWCGVHDLAGNVWEWCHDELRDHDDDEQFDPGLESVGNMFDGGLRVLRGGSWDFPARDLRVATRYGGGPSNRYPSCGFRIARGHSSGK